MSLSLYLIYFWASWLYDYKFQRFLSTTYLNMFCLIFLLASSYYIWWLHLLTWVLFIFLYHLLLLCSLHTYNSFNYFISLQLCWFVMCLHLHSLHDVDCRILKLALPCLSVYVNNFLLELSFFKSLFCFIWLFSIVILDSQSIF